MTNDYPRMMYHEDGRTKTVLNEGEESLSHAVGFVNTPFDVHRRVQSFVPENSLAKTPAQGSKPDDPFGLLAMGDLIIARIRTEVVPEIVDALAMRLISEFAQPSEADADAPADPAKPRRGRPPKDRSAFNQHENQEPSNV